MHIKVDQFCSLATSPSWQTWLYNNYDGLYREFMQQLRESRGCSQNREIMESLLQQIDQDGLIIFLRKYYPHMLRGQADGHLDKLNEEDLQALEDDGIFKHYNPNILTYPRRQIFIGPKNLLRKKANEFLLDKIKSDYIIIGDRVYIEYLKKSDVKVADKIPISNWQIAMYRQK